MWGIGLKMEVLNVYRGISQYVLFVFFQFLQELDILSVIKLEYHRTNVSTLVAFVFPGYEAHLKH